MATGGISGKDGDVKIGATQVAEIEKWDFNPKAKNPRYISNMTAGYEAVVPGTKSGAGTLSGVWNPAVPATTQIAIATAVVLKLYINATQFYSVNAVIDDFKLTTDLSGEIVGWTASFSANGAWTDPIATGPITIGDDERRFVFDAPLQTDAAAHSMAA